MSNVVAEAGLNQIPVGYKQTEVGVIPEDWEVAKIAEKHVIATGSTPPTSNLKNYGETYLFVSPADLSDKKYILQTEKKLSEQGFTISRKYPAGSTLFTCIGSTIGKTGLALIKLTSNQQINAIFPNDDNDAEFTYYAITYIAPKIKVLAGQQAVPLVNKTEFGETIFCFPRDKHEQTAIANALSDVDALNTELEKLIAKKQAIKTATMQQLLTGRTRLPQFALREDGSNKGTKQSELGEIPEDWDIKTYGEVFTFLSTATNSRADLSEDGDFGYVHYGDIHTKWNNKLDLNKENLPTISKDIVRSAFIMNGDLIMADTSEDYEGIGKSVEVFNVGHKLLIAGLHTFLLRDKDKVFADNFRGYLYTIPAVKNTFDRLATGMKVYGISKQNLSAVCIPVPNIDEQTAIATILSDMDEEIQALEQRLSKTHQIKQGMMQELLTGRTRLV